MTLRKRLQAIRRDARLVASLLELGDARLVASDGPCGGQNAATALSPGESGRLYAACRRLAKLADVAAWLTKEVPDARS